MVQLQESSCKNGVRSSRPAGMGRFRVCIGDCLNYLSDCRGAGPAADTDKMIAMQLVLDVQEFGRLAKEAGVELAQVEAYQELWGVVATPADQGAGA